MASVGGINIQVGVNLSTLQRGFKQGESYLRDFQRAMSRVRLDKAIKDPMISSTKYINEAGKQLNRVYKDWSSDINVVGNNMSKFATRSKKSIQEVIAQYDKLKTAMSRIKSYKEPLLVSGKPASAVGKKGGFAPLREWFALGDDELKDFRKELRTLSKGAPEEAKEGINKFLKDLDRGVKVNVKTIQDRLSVLRRAIDVTYKETSKEYEKYGAVLRREMKRQEALKYIGGLEDAKNIQAALEQRKRAVMESAVAERKARTEIQQGINVQKNRIAILGELEKRERLGIKLSDRQAKEYEDLTVAVGKLAKHEGLRVSKHQAELRLAKSTQEALKRRGAELRKLKVEEQKLRTEISLGINVQQNRVALGKVLSKQQALGINMSQKTRRELKRLQKEQQRLAEQQRASRDQLFSPTWFKQRVRWFVQLRLFWEIWRQGGAALRDVTEFHDQLARALRTARSEIRDTQQVAEDYAHAMRDAAEQFGAAWEDIGEVLYQLGSAGLSAEESLQALNSTMALIVGTEGDARETTKAIAGIYNNFGKTIKHVTTENEKFLYITDLVASAWERHQVELSEMTDGLKYSANIATLAGLQLNQLVSIISVLNDHMIKGGRAGRTLTNVLMRMARAPVEFAKAFKVEEIFDPTKPLDFIKIMDILSERMRQGRLSAYSLAIAFERMGLRGAPTFETLLKFWNEYREDVERTMDVSGSAMELQEKRMNSLSGQWKILIGNFRGALSELKPLLDAFTEDLRKINEGLENMLRRGPEYRGPEVLGRFKGLEKGSKEFAKMAKSLTKENLTTLRDYILYLGELEELLSIDYRKDAQKRKKTIKEERDLIHSIIVARREASREEEKDTLKRIKLSLSEAEMRIKWMDREIDKSKKIDYLDDQIADKLDTIRKQKKAMNEIDVKDLASAQNRMKMAEELEKYYGELEKLERERKKTLDEIEEIYEQEIKDRISIKGLQRDALNNQITQLKNERRSLEKRQLTNEEYEKTKRINETILRLQKLVAEKEREIAHLRGENYEAAFETEESAKKQADSEKRISDEQEKQLNIQYKRRQLIIEAEKKAIAKERELTIAKIENKNRKEILRLEEESLRITLDRLEKERELVTGAYDRSRLTNQINRLNVEILENMEKQKRAADGLYDAYRRLQESTKDVQQFWSDVIVGSVQETSSGLANVMTKVTGGFQEAQQEAENLKGEVAELEAERQELAEKGLLSEEEAERFKEIQSEIARLNSEISDLEDPIENLKDAFKDFAKSVVDNIREMINEWIAWQIVSGLAKGILGGAMSAPSGSVEGGMASFGITSLKGHASGGILPQIKSFREFSQGGLTSRPTLAFLGDNPSKKELVIPFENIESDKVSGHTRGSEPVTLINVVTEEDLARELSKPRPGKVIVNRVYQDLDEGMLGRKFRSR